VSSLPCASIEAYASIEAFFRHTANFLHEHFFYLVNYFILIYILSNVLGQLLNVQFGVEVIEIRCRKDQRANFVANFLVLVDLCLTITSLLID
jgi:hypothetical protein